MKKIIQLLCDIFTFKFAIWAVLIISLITSIILVYCFDIEWKTALLSFFISIIQLSIGILIVNIWLDRQKEKEKIKQKQEDEKEKVRLEMEKEKVKQEVADTIFKLFRRHIRGFNQNLWNWAVEEEYKEDVWRNLIENYIDDLKENKRGYQHLSTNDREKIKKIIIEHHKDFKPLILNLQIALDEISQLVNWHLDSRLYTNTINAKYQIRYLLDLCTKLSKKRNNTSKTKLDIDNVDNDATCALLEIDIYSQETLRMLDAMKNSTILNLEVSTSPVCLPTK